MKIETQIWLISVVVFLLTINSSLIFSTVRKLHNKHLKIVEAQTTMLETQTTMLETQCRLSKSQLTLSLNHLRNLNSIRKLQEERCLE